MILGIDEAGRGPVLGPLVVAGVVLHPRRAGALKRRGVVDSKLFGAGDDARRERAALAAHIRRLAEHVDFEVFDPSEVDTFAADGRLNELERRGAREIIARSGAVRRIVADGRRLFSLLTREFPHLEAHDFGESVHVAVAAASIIAKVERDRLFDLIAHRYETEFGQVRGGGYVNAATAAFLRSFYQRYGRFPDETRRSWGWRLLRELEPLPLPLFDGNPLP